jgi:hypothetical protein
MLNRALLFSSDSDSEFYRHFYSYNPIHGSVVRAQKNRLYFFRDAKVGLRDIFFFLTNLFEIWINGHFKLPKKSNTQFLGEK